MSFHSRISHAFDKAPVLPLSRQSRYAIISDCHRGRGNSNDNFLKNQNLYFTALSHYYERGFTYIELGDGDELWENRKMSQIVEIHSDVFWLLSLYRRQGRLYMVYGNHDMEKKKAGFGNLLLDSCFCREKQCIRPFFEDLPFYEGLILENASQDFRLFLTHGHQADFFNSACWKLTRFLVRHLWEPMEHFGVLDPTSAAKNYVHKDMVEQRLSRYAMETKRPLITGHTHRPRLNPQAPYYINTGSCVHPRCIACLEIVCGKMILVKWTLSVREDKTLYVAREILSEYPLSLYCQPIL